MTNAPASAEKQDLLAQLTDELNAWYDTQGLPHICALEALHWDITPDQREWLEDFNERWDAAVDADDAIGQASR